MLAHKRIFGGILALGSALALLTGCLDKSEAVPTFGGSELYPLTVGTYRIFAVADTSWKLNKPTITTYQLRETVADSLPSLPTSVSPAGTSYRVVRARRADATKPWADDSIFVLTSLPQALLLSRGNRRTVELLYPVRVGQVWNRLAFDAQDSTDRAYRRVDEPVTLQLPGGQSKQYEHSVRTADLDEDNQYYHRTSEQIFVPNVGPVHRRRRNLSTYELGTGGEQTPNPAYIFEGTTHQEVLIEQGRMK
jgi:hypothetical protein